MTLIMEMDDLRKDFPPQKWDLTIPLETRMAFLKKYNSYQHGIIQDDCAHAVFEKGICAACDFKCEHPDAENGYCPDCREFQEPFQPDRDDFQESFQEEKN